MGVSPVGVSVSFYLDEKLANVPALLVLQRVESIRSGTQTALFRNMIY